MFGPLARLTLLTYSLSTTSLTSSWPIIMLSPARSMVCPLDTMVQIAVAISPVQKAFEMKFMISVIALGAVRFDMP